MIAEHGGRFESAEVDGSIGGARLAALMNDVVANDIVVGKNGSLKGSPRVDAGRSVLKMKILAGLVDEARRRPGNVGDR